MLIALFLEGRNLRQEWLDPPLLTGGRGALCRRDNTRNGK